MNSWNAWEDVDTPVFLPFLYGERCPGENEERSGGFYGLKPYHDRRSMYRAVQEGVLFNLRQGYEELCPDLWRAAGHSTVRRDSALTGMVADVRGYF